MKNKILKILSCLMTICLTVCILSQLTNLMERKDSDEKYADFFAQEEDFDVLYMGTSHVINAIYPMEMWNNYGIVSYNFGGHRNQLATSYWVMENALDYTNPKVVVIDGYLLEEDFKASEAFSYVHLSLDAFPLSLTKIKAIWDLLDDPYLEEQLETGEISEMNEPRTKIGLLWDYAVYHSRWTELAEDDFAPVNTIEKGAETRIGHEKAKFTANEDLKVEDVDTVSTEYLIRLIESCKSRGIDVVITYLPFVASDTRQNVAQYLYKVADEYDVAYINFLDEDVINYKTDMYDKKSHLNPSGARKVSDYLAEYLVENYDIEDRRNDSAYASWNEDYVVYTAFKNENLSANEDIYQYLSLLYGEDVEVRIDIRNSNFFKDGMVREFLRNLGVDTGEIADNTDLLIINGESGEYHFINGLRENGVALVDGLGEMKIEYADDGSRNFQIALNGEEYISGNEEDGTGVQFDVYRDGNRIDSVKFTFSYDKENKVIKTKAANR